MITEAQIEESIKALFGNIRFAQEPSGLYDPLRYMMAIGGKRIRPRLCLTAYSLYKEELCESVLQAAAALEVYHGSTLLHDDILDNSPMRRGVDTVWKKWDCNTAILSGDVMVLDAYRRLEAVEADILPKILKDFNAMTTGIMEGQQYDTDFEERQDVSMEEYMHMTGLKTSLLIATSARIGALIGGATQADADHLYSYGYDLGLAFQIEDDYLDTFGDEKVFGKPIGGDIVNNKKTWLMIKAMEKDGYAMKQALAMPCGDERQKADKIARVSELYRSLGVEAAAKEEIQRYFRSAMEHAQALELGRIKTEILSRYASSLVGRSR